MRNIHYYVQDPRTGIIFRTVGYTYMDDLIVYPKYIPSLEGTRGEKAVKYRGIHYPTGSINFLASNSLPENAVVKIKFNDVFHTFLPMAKKNKLILYDPQEQLATKISESTQCGKLLEELISILVKQSGVKQEYFGLDASLLVGMDKEGSDIDLVVYGVDNAKLVRNAWEEISETSEELMGPEKNEEAIIQRRQSYSPLMTGEEIIAWEKCKISGYFKGVKFSIMPINPDGKYQTIYVPTEQFAAIRVKLCANEILYDPGILELENHKVEIVYGPKEIKIRQFITFLPSRMGIFLKKGDELFILGKIYVMDCKQEKPVFSLTQFPWDDRSYLGESYFVAKKEICNLQNMIPSLLGLNFKESYFTE